MRNPPCGAHFIAKALQRFLVRGAFGQERERHFLPQAKVVGAVDFAHSAPPQQRNDAVTPSHQRSGQKAAFVSILPGGRRWRARRRSRTAGLGNWRPGWSVGRQRLRHVGTGGLPTRRTERSRRLNLRSAGRALLHLRHPLPNSQYLIADSAGPDPGNGPVFFSANRNLAATEECFQFLNFAVGHVEVAPRAFRVARIHRLLGFGNVGSHIAPGSYHVSTQAHAVVVHLLLKRIEAALDGRSAAVELIAFRLHGIPQSCLLPSSLLLSLELCRRWACCCLWILARGLVLSRHDCGLMGNGGLGRLELSCLSLWRRRALTLTGRTVGGRTGSDRRVRCQGRRNY